MERWATSTAPPANAVGSSSPRARERGVPSTGRATPPCCVSLRTSCSSRAGVMWNTLAKEPCNARSNCRAWRAERTASSGASPAWTGSCYIRHFFLSHYHEAVVAGPGGDLRIGGIPLSLRDIHAFGVLVRRNVSRPVDRSEGDTLIVLAGGDLANGFPTDKLPSSSGDELQAFWFLARPERLELPTYWFEASRSIHLSYGRATTSILAAPTLPPPPDSPVPQALPPAPPSRRRVSASAGACAQNLRPPAYRSR